MAEHSYAEAKKINTAVLAALLVLTAVTVAAAGIHFETPAVNTIVALAIASMKASLVALFFMHLRYEKPINAIIFLTGIAMLAVFLGLTLLDVDYRSQPRPANLKPPPGGFAFGVEQAKPAGAPASPAPGAPEQAASEAPAQPAEGTAPAH